jgi:shikimate kinase
MAILRRPPHAFEHAATAKTLSLTVINRMPDMAAATNVTLSKPVVLVGLMGAGKSCIGRQLATALGVDFVDADAEIEAAAGCTIEQIFESHGESAFRDGERRVIARLLGQPPHILASGGGAFVDPATRQAIREGAISVWLRADLEILLRRTARRDHRPLLKAGDPRKILQDLMTKRYPIYAEADIIVDSADGPPEVTRDRVLAALKDYLQESAAQ